MKLNYEFGSCLKVNEAGMKEYKFTERSYEKLG